jgi:hypothetical protein
LIQVPTVVLYQPDEAVFPDMRPTAAAIKGALLGTLPSGDNSPRAKAQALSAGLDGD